MALTQGTRLGRYEILAHVGKGGMGEVYRARDTRLGRIVAIKILAEELSNDPDRRARFEREARSASLLNHPNIAMLYDIGSEGSTDYIVSEFIDGESLRSLMNRGPVPAPQLVDIAIQAADGLGAAHAAGIVHRDLKPENLMLTRDGRLKILDFGIAKRVSQQVDPNQTTNVHATVAGVVLGTIGYMSPEQLSGKPVDARSDIFCFGVVLYEMAAGKPPFGAGNTVEMLTAILRDEPAKLQTRVPSKVEQLIRRCLEKAPERRFQSTGELAAALQNARRSGDRPAKEPDARQIPTRPSTKRRTIGFLAALAGPGIIAAIVVGAINYPRAPKKAPTSNGPSQVALVVDKLKPQGYVSDFAHVLDASSYAQLEGYAGRVEQATGAQMAIVTVDTLGGQPVEGFANSLYRQWGIGKKGKDEGLLLLFAIKDHRDRLVVGRGLEAILPGDFDANVLRQARPLLRQGAYRPALFAAAEEIGSHIAQAKGVQLNFSLRPRSTTPPRAEPSPRSDQVDPPKSTPAVLRSSASSSPAIVAPEISPVAPLPAAPTPAISQPPDVLTVIEQKYGPLLSSVHQPNGDFIVMPNRAAPDLNAPAFSLVAFNSAGAFLWSWYPAGIRCASLRRSDAGGSKHRLDSLLACTTTEGYTVTLDIDNRQRWAVTMLRENPGGNLVTEIDLPGGDVIVLMKSSGRGSPRTREWLARITDDGKSVWIQNSSSITQVRLEGGRLIASTRVGNTVREVNKELSVDTGRVLKFP